MNNIVIFTGPMKSGKSEALLSLYNKYKIAEKHVVLIKPKLDTRTPGKVATRNNKEENAIELETTKDIKLFVESLYEHYGENINALFIDEFQFFKGVIQYLLELADKGIELFISGLNLTAEKQPFGIMSDIMCFASNINIFTAICDECKSEAQYTFCKITKKKQILVGNDCYESVCEKCYNKLINRDT